MQFQQKYQSQGILQKSCQDDMYLFSILNLEILKIKMH